MAKKEIIIHAEQDQTRIALVENGDLTEFYIETPEHERTLGDIFLGKVRRIMPSIQAAFVDIGQKQDAFLHFSDLSENLPDQLAFLEEENPHLGDGSTHSDSHRTRSKRRHPRHDKKEASQGNEAAEPHKKRSASPSRGKRRSAQRRSQRGSSGKQKGGGKGQPNGEQRSKQQRRPAHSGPFYHLLKRDQRILVKVVKEPMASKGSRVSTDISLAGRFLVLVPFADYVAVSKKIVSYKERRRLRALAKSLLPTGFGTIVRTVADGKNAKALDTDLQLLIDKWRKIEGNLEGFPEPPKVVHEDVSMVSSVIRDLFSDDYDRVLIDDHRLFRNVKGYVQAVAPQMANVVKPYKGKQHIFEAAGIDKDVADAFKSRLDLPSGGYLFLEKTEAMHVIDVNSGRSGRGMSQEDSSLKVNIEAARVIARQTRLRDIGGIIVIDFIDLRDERNKRKVFDELRKEFRRDRAVTKVLPMSDFGLVQITRQRLRPSLTTTFSGPNGESNGDTNGDDKPEAKEKEKGKRDDRSKRDDRGRREPAKKERREEAPREKQETQGKKRGRGGRSSQRGDGRRDSRPPKMTPEKLVEQMERWIVGYRAQGNRRAVILRVHPFTGAFLNRKVPNYPTRWFMKHLLRVRLEMDEQLPPLAYRFFDTRSGDDLTDSVQPEQQGDRAKTAN